MIVIDACTLLSRVLDDENSEHSKSALRYVARHGALVPGNFVTEIINGLARAERRGRIDEVNSGIALTEILNMPLTIEAPDPHAIRAIVRTRRLTAYDAAYLALALQEHIPLATVDTALRSAADAGRCAWEG